MLRASWRGGEGGMLAQFGNKRYKNNHHDLPTEETIEIY
jgi:hypothetical protein